MKIILLGEELKQSLTFDLKREWLWAGVGLLALLILSLLFTAWLAIDRGSRINQFQTELQQMQQDMLQEQHELNSFYAYADAVFTEHARQAGELQARMARLEALGGRLADMSNVESEFDFYTVPAIGGPHESLQEADSQLVAGANVMEDFIQLTSTLEQREHELQAMESLLTGQQLIKERYLAGIPVEKGWLSSHYGKRRDPFHGRMAWHKGVDFAGKEGTMVLAVASGVVVWSGDRYGYGEMVEIDHGNGFTTRYGHNEKNLVKMGEVVKKGQAIAAMGSTGRSTGPHVHFEVLKFGQQVDPQPYIYRKSI